MKAEKELAKAKEQLKQQMQQAGAMGQIPPEMQQKFEQAEKELLRQEAVLKASKKDLAKGKNELQASKKKLNSSASLLRKKEKSSKREKKNIDLLRRRLTVSLPRQRRRSMMPGKR